MPSPRKVFEQAEITGITGITGITNLTGITVFFLKISLWIRDYYLKFSY